MIKLDADMSGVAGYIGSVGGILDAVQSPAYKGAFIDDLMGWVRTHFRTDTIAANQSGIENLAHVFEWPDQMANGVSTKVPSTIPLFSLTKQGKPDARVLSFYFRPSVKPVPLPDPAKYGFKPEKLDFMRRHVFKMKALVMETQANVTIAPRYSRKLFIPDENNKYGYYMTSQPTSINPGGLRSTGAFGTWWTAWFDTRAQELVTEKVKLGEEFIKATGQKIVRDATTGRFSRGTKQSFAYVDAAKRTAELEMLAAAKSRYEDEGDWDDV